MLTVLFNMFGEMLLSNSQGWLLQIKYNILKNIHIEQNRTECLYCHYTVIVTILDRVRRKQPVQVVSTGCGAVEGY